MFSVILSRPPKATQKTTQKILELIMEQNEITTSEMAETLGLSRSAIAKSIAWLKQNGKIKRFVPDKGGHWQLIPNK